MNCLRENMYACSAVSMIACMLCVFVAAGQNTFYFVWVMVLTGSCCVRLCKVLKKIRWDELVRNFNSLHTFFFIRNVPINWTVFQWLVGESFFSIYTHLYSQVLRIYLVCKIHSFKLYSNILLLGFGFTVWCQALPGC